MKSVPTTNGMLLQEAAFPFVVVLDIMVSVVIVAVVSVADVEATDVEAVA